MLIGQSFRQTCTFVERQTFIQLRRLTNRYKVTYGKCIFLASIAQFTETSKGTKLIFWSCDAPRTKISSGQNARKRRNVVPTVKNKIYESAGYDWQFIFASQLNTNDEVIAMSWSARANFFLVNFRCVSFKSDLTLKIAYRIRTLERHLERSDR